MLGMQRLQAFPSGAVGIFSHFAELLPELAPQVHDATPRRDATCARGIKAALMALDLWSQALAGCVKRRKDLSSPLPPAGLADLWVPGAGSGRRRPLPSGVAHCRARWHERRRSSVATTFDLSSLGKTGSDLWVEQNFGSRCRYGPRPPPNPRVARPQCITDCARRFGFLR